MKFSIIVVALNPGEKLKKTLSSIFAQSYTDYEVILKDGGSTDGSVDTWEEKRCSRAEAEYGSAGSRVQFFCQKDAGIYDAMNQAVSHAKGEFILFLNCGDVFADEKVLERTAAAIEKERLRRKDRKHASAGGQETDSVSDREEKMVLYGDTLSEKNDVVIAAPPEITGFTCYRNIPCHQSCFYSAALCREKPYDLQYKIRADYEHFLWCFYHAGAEMVYLGFPVSVYEGGGYSEKKANQKRDAREHKEITKTYIPQKELLKYRTIMLLTLAPLRRKMAENKAFTGFYHWLKRKIYGK